MSALENDIKLLDPDTQNTQSSRFKPLSLSAIRKLMRRKPRYNGNF